MKTTLMTMLLAIYLYSPAFQVAAFADMDEANSAYDKGNYEQAFSMYKQYAEKGDALAQYDVGLMYYDGTGVSQDFQKAAQWVAKAAEKGLAEAQTLLGGMYFEGKGVKQDYEVSVKWYLVAAKKGNVDAEYNMGYMYENGFGVPMDCDRAEEWYSRAASQGDEEAQEILQSFSCREYANVASLGAGSGDILRVLSPGRNEKEGMAQGLKGNRAGARTAIAIL